jgi:hypothetical protein
MFPYGNTAYSYLIYSGVATVTHTCDSRCPTVEPLLRLETRHELNK